MCRCESVNNVPCASLGTQVVEGQPKGHSWTRCVAGQRGKTIRMSRGCGGDSRLSNLHRAKGNVLFFSVMIHAEVPYISSHNKAVPGRIRQRWSNGFSVQISQ